MSLLDPSPLNYKELLKYIAKDKPGAARNFKSNLIKEIEALSKMPYKCRRSIFFEREDIRDFIFKGYIIVYKINESSKTLEVFGITKWEENPLV